MSQTPSPIVRVNTGAWRGGAQHDTLRALPEEVAVALTYDSATFAVMMASPADLKDFAIGFSLSEGIINSVHDILDFQIITVEYGIECRMSLASKKREALDARRRHITGPMGCGLCGLDSLKEASRNIPKVQSNLHITAQMIADAGSLLACLQILNHETRAVHAAAFFVPSRNDILLREDVGRHNALDKLIGAVAHRGDTPSAGVVFVTSRVSLDLIQKTAAFGASVLVAISVPTARAVREAHAAGITLIAIARDDGFEIFTHPERVIFGAQSNAA